MGNEKRGGFGGDREKIKDWVGFQTDSCSGLTRGMEEGYARVRQTGWANEAGLLGQDMMSKLGDTVWCYPIEVTEGIKNDGSSSACPTFSHSKTHRLAWRGVALCAKTLFFSRLMCHFYSRRPLLSSWLREG